MLQGKELKELFCSPYISQKLIDIGFDKSKCFIGIDSFDCIRHKFASTSDGDYINWDLRYDNTKPLILFEQAIIFLNTQHQLNIETQMGKDENSVWWDWYIEYSKIVVDAQTDYSVLASSSNGLETKRKAQNQAIEKCIDIIMYKHE